MQRIILIMLFLISGIVSSVAQEKYTITLNFKGIKSDKGSLFVAVYNTENTFLKKPYRATIVKVVGKKATVILKDIPVGIYAVSTFHDINDNKKMDTNFLGIPKEPTGVSNNAKAFMGPPKYKDAKFKVVDNVVLNINIK